MFFYCLHDILQSNTFQKKYFYIYLFIYYLFGNLIKVPSNCFDPKNTSTKLLSQVIADDILIFFSNYFSEKIRVSISYDTSA